MGYEQRIIELVKSDELRMRALRAVHSINLPGWIIAAGFVGNLVWESLFNRKGGTYDIDVIYFFLSDSSPERDAHLEKRLRELEPDFLWSVKNQARMHLKCGDTPYFHLPPSQLKT